MCRTIEEVLSSAESAGYRVDLLLGSVLAEEEVEEPAPDEAESSVDEEEVEETEKEKPAEPEIESPAKPVKPA
jgi:hypothetical protein